MRIIAEKVSPSRWAAWWNDAPSELVTSASVWGAVARLLIQSSRDVAARDLVEDKEASESGRVEMVVLVAH